MFILNKIKYNADKNYDIYEQKVQKYYKIENRFFSINLESYICKFYIQSHLYGVFYNDKVNTISDVLIYVKCLYIAYYDFYIKNIINDGESFIVTQEIIDKYLKQKNYKQDEIYIWIKNNCEINVPLDEYILNVLNKKYLLPVFQRFAGVQQDDLYGFMAKFLDFIINDNKDKIILSIAMGHI